MAHSQSPPAWLAELEDQTPLTSNSSSHSNSGNGSSSGSVPLSAVQSPDLLPIPPMIKQFCTPLVVRQTLKAITMVLCVLMFATACVGIQKVNGVNTAGKIFVATYMLFFAVLLFLFEAIQLRNIEWLDHMFQRNFGFLYSVMGKALFVIFIAFLSFGLGDPQGLTMATGLSLACFGAAKVALFLKYPELFEDEAAKQRAAELQKGQQILSASL